MRWDAQKIDAEAERSLPGLATERVRTFDAPEALDIRFHEVRAKSALNKVPGDYLPFDYTVNAFRGCSHACTYCASGETRVLMADGRTRPLAEVQVGDRIYGTVRRGAYRRYVITEVLAHWSSHKDAYRTTLEDGTELVTSGDHLFLSDRGWKHVQGAEQAGATFVNGIALHLRPGVKEVFMGWLRSARPDLVPRYERLYARGAYAPAPERERIGALVRGPDRSTDPRFSLRERYAKVRAEWRERAEAGRTRQTSLF